MKVSIRLEPGGTEAGYHSYLNLLGCQRKYVLDQQAREEFEQSGFSNEDFLAKHNGRNRGTISHSYLEWYHSSYLIPDEIEFENNVHPNNIKEAKYIVNWYLNQGGCELFHGVRGVEFEFSSEQYPRISDVLGISPFTGKIDLIVDLTDWDIKRMISNFTLAGTAYTGRWLVDWKVYAKESSWLRENAKAELQYKIYMMAYKALTGIEPTGALQATLLCRKKNPACVFVPVWFPGEKEQQIVRGFFSQVHDVIEDEKFPRCNLTKCTDFIKRPCRHLLSGRCDRI